jgi:hypothetical protein
MKKLIEILKRETKSLKKQYIEMTCKWADSNYDRMSSTNESQIISTRGYKNQYGRMEHTKASYSFWCSIYSIVVGGKENYIAKQKKEAEQHYEGSIEKLALRIVQKKINITSLKVKTSHIGVNIDTILSDGDISVKAFTIIAGGLVQRPHYRYLIK